MIGGIRDEAAWSVEFGNEGGRRWVWRQKWTLANNPSRDAIQCKSAGLQVISDPFDGHDTVLIVGIDNKRSPLDYGERGGGGEKGVVWNRHIQIRGWRERKTMR